MRSIIIFTILLLTIVAVKSEIKTVINKSGDIIIQAPKSSPSQLFLKGNAFNGNSLDNIQDVEISNLISHVMGLLPLNSQQKDRESFPNQSVFNKPKLNLLFTVDSISKESIKDLTFLDNGIEIEKTFYPMDSVSELTTIATGVTPDVHGIVSKEWFANGQKVTAFSSGDKKSQPLSANVADILSQTFSGKSLIVSTSSNKKFTSALALHNTLSNKNAYGFYSSSKQSIQSLNNKAENLEELALTQNKIETILYSKEFKEFVLPSSEWSISMKSGLLHITADNGKTLVFNLDSEIDNSLLTELVMLFHTVSVLSKSEGHFNKLAKDSIPDMLSFSFTNHQNLATSYQNLEVYRVAITMINNAMKSAYEQLQALYGGRVACEIITLAPESNNFDLIKRVEDVLEGDETLPISESFPHLYLKSTHKNVESREQLCKTIQNSLQELKVHCIDSHTYIHAQIVDGEASSTSSASSSSQNSGEELQSMADTAQIAAFQIFLFFPIVWVLFIAGGALLMMKVSSDAQKDTLLYRNSNRAY